MAVNKSFLKYAESYSGIDGGDIGAEYWFMGMEWSKAEDIDGDYDEKSGIWKIKNRDDISENINIAGWKLEEKMNELYQKLPNRVSQKTIFEKNSNSFKLNLLPLPFVGTNEYDEGTQKKNINIPKGPDVDILTNICEKYYQLGTSYFKNCCKRVKSLKLFFVLERHIIKSFYLL